MIKQFITLLCLTTCFSTWAQVEIISEQTYDAGALYGYMNGGSELYKEYGFKKLVVQEVACANEELKFECYEMNSPQSAFGIYTVNVFKCTTNKLLNITEVCESDYQLQAVVGPCYLSIINTNGSVAAQDAARKVLNDYIQNYNETDAYKLPQYIKRLSPDNVLFMNGSLAIENRADAWLQHYKKLDISSCYILKWASSKASILVFTSKQTCIKDMQSDELLVKQKNKITYLLRKSQADDYALQLFKDI